MVLLQKHWCSSCSKQLTVRDERKTQIPRSVVHIGFLPLQQGVSTWQNTLFHSSYQASPKPTNLSTKDKAVQHLYYVFPARLIIQSWL